MYKENERNVFEIRNSYEFISVKAIGDFFKKGFTTKSKGTSRGIGLCKLKQMLETKNGTIDFYYDTELEEVIAKISYF